MSVRPAEVNVYQELGKSLLSPMGHSWINIRLQLRPVTCDNGLRAWFPALPIEHAPSAWWVADFGYVPGERKDSVVLFGSTAFALDRASLYNDSK